ncbi:MAG: OmpH family outer membrane protein [Halomonas sp.]|uniref:OmpH family outer membrane protein n=1 Tax=Halomonas sp. TaxID=1486246 RepID=UPI0019E80F73|nr:OmpH family outer membrane protein [Halomonas sp.]MBE0489592.1 OmpH family outer membrane protein [Halomonas sp.]
MRRLTAALSLVLLAALALPAQAAEVALLDWRRALMQTDAAQRSMSELEGRIGSQQRQAQSLDQELSQLQQRASSLTDSERQEANRKASELNRLVGEIMQAQQEAEQRFLSNAESRLEQAVEQVIARHGIDVLVEPQGVLHSSQDLPDLTGEVTQILNTLL